MPVVSKLALVAVERAEGLLQMQGQFLGADDKLNYEEVQMSLCGLLTVRCHYYVACILPCGSISLSCTGCHSSLGYRGQAHC